MSPNYPKTIQKWARRWLDKAPMDDTVRVETLFRSFRRFCLLAEHWNTEPSKRSFRDALEATGFMVVRRYECWPWCVYGVALRNEPRVASEQAPQ